MISDECETWRYDSKIFGDTIIDRRSVPDLCLRLSTHLNYSSALDPFIVCIPFLTHFDEIKRWTIKDAEKTKMTTQQQRRIEPSRREAEAVHYVTSTRNIMFACFEFSTFDFVVPESPAFSGRHEFDANGFSFLLTSCKYVSVRADFKRQPTNAVLCVWLAHERQFPKTKSFWAEIYRFIFIYAFDCCCDVVIVVQICVGLNSDQLVWRVHVSCGNVTVTGSNITKFVVCFRQQNLWIQIAFLCFGSFRFRSAARYPSWFVCFYGLIQMHGLCL